MSKKRILSPEQIEALKRQELELLTQKKALIEGLPHKYGWKWYKWAKTIYESLNREIFCTAANQISKAVHVDTEIPTPHGIKRMGDLKVGDLVFGQDGTPTEIIDIPFVGDEESYEIEFNDFSRVIAGKNHDWIAKGYEERFRKTYTIRRGKNSGTKYANPTYGKWKVVSTSQIIREGKYCPETSAPKRFSIPVTQACAYLSPELFDPYFLGVYLGNGGEHSVSLNNADTDIAEHCQKYGVRYNTERLIVGVLQETKSVLDSLGVRVKSYEKEIPHQYLAGSIEQRTLLLQGLMDTDGTCAQNGASSSYCTTSPKLAQQVLELVCSLGGISQIKQYPSSYLKDTGESVSCRDHYIVYIWTRFNPFKSKRKSEQWRFSEKYKHERVITKITPVGKSRVKCITVNNVDGSFLCTRDYIVTHNSSTAIRKNIEWATNPDIWKRAWPSLAPGQKPNTFIYFYPSLSLATIEFESKWEPLFLPRNEYKTHPIYGWKEEYEKNHIHCVRFNSGVSIYFKSYEQKLINLQAITAYMVTLDEECPEELLPEIQARLNSTDGFLLSVFTATLGQLYWEKTMEAKSQEEELHKNALKMSVSVYECQQYEDGSYSHWTPDKIKRAVDRCSSPAEIARRIMGRFVKSEGLRFHGFDRHKHVVPKHPLPRHWLVYTAVDPGTGGVTGHPAGIIFVSVDPSFKQARIFRAWRGDGVSTTSQDILNKYRELRGQLKPVVQVYDYAAKDFFLVASRQGESFTQASKDRESNFGLVNVLFKNGMLKVQDGDPELDKLVSELCNISETAKKSDHVTDDLADSLCYCCASVPWDFSEHTSQDESLTLAEEPLEPEKTSSDLRREWFKNEQEEAEDVQEELDFWNEQAGS